ncbi:hypothetical protein ADL01_25105 [Streptomyces sp. NRRL WC-3618]|nr:hypothetical protein ADL01_25105 [Streptomyces sp. NRRL WC-3618]
MGVEGPHQRERLLAVTAALPDPDMEVGEAIGGDPGGVAFEGRDAGAHRAGSRQLGERGGNGVQRGAQAAEVRITLDRRPYAGRQVQPLIAGQVGGLAEPQPTLDAALAVTHPVVVLDSARSGAAQRRVVEPGEDQGVLDGDVPLVVEAVGDPGAQLVTRQLPSVHPEVEGVPVVVTLLGDGTQPLGELGSPPRGRGAVVAHGRRGHARYRSPNA